MSTFHLQIVTPDGSAFDGEAEGLRLRTTEGYVSILAGHAEYLAAMDICMVTVTVGGAAKNAACGGGFLSVEKGAVRLVATTFEYADAIDVARAKQAEERAKARIAAAQDDKDVALARVKLARALNRIGVAEKGN